MKKEYFAPRLEKVGSFEALTKGNADGAYTDAVFPTDTPKSDLTFSDLP